MEEAPKAKPVSGRKSSQMMYRMTIPSRPSPTTVMPMTVPELKAVRRAGLRPVWARAAVRTLARTAMAIPRYPAPAESAAPIR